MNPLVPTPQDYANHMMGNSDHPMLQNIERPYAPKLETQNQSRDVQFNDDDVMLAQSAYAKERHGYEVGETQASGRGRNLESNGGWNGGRQK